MKTIKITEEAYEILSTIKWISRSKSFSETIKKMDGTIMIFAPKDSIVNRIGLVENKIL